MSLINNRFSFVDRKNPLNFAAPDPLRDGMRSCADGMTDGGRLLSLGRSACCRIEWIQKEHCFLARNDEE